MNWFGFCGLLLNIIGAILIWKYGLPEIMNWSGSDNVVWGGRSEEAEKRKAKRKKRVALYDRLSLSGIVLLIV